MTQLRANPYSLTNYFDDVLRGVGARGSSFSDIDRIDAAPVVITHDGPTHRFLIQEFKREGERLTRGQERLLEDVAKTPLFSAWLVVARNDGRFDWTDFAASDSTEPETLTRDEYRERFRAWWGNRSHQSLRHDVISERITDEDMRW